MHHDIHNLIFQAIDGTIGAEDFDRLQDAIELDASVRADYLRAVALCDNLGELAYSELADGNSSERNEKSEAVSADGRNDLSPETVNPTSSRRARFALTKWISALAATLLVGVTLGTYLTRTDTASVSENHFRLSSDTSASPVTSGTPSPTEDAIERAPLYVSQVVSMTPDVIWRKNSALPDFLLRLRIGDRVSIRSGLVQLEYFTGANIILHGPCTFINTGEKSGRLVQGHLTGKVDGGDFLLTTPTARVVDLGTEFGVAVHPTAGTDVLVFDGEVRIDLDHAMDDEACTLSLTEGMSARVSGSGEIDATRLVNANRFSRDLPNTRPNMVDQLSLVDLMSATASNRFRLAGVIAPNSGRRDQNPWLKADGPGHRIGFEYQQTTWHPYVDGVFIPSDTGISTELDSAGHHVDLPPSSGRTWGPVWSRRKIEGPASVESYEDYWGTMTLEPLVERLAQCEIGMIGIHSNVGVTFDLDAARKLAGSLTEFRCTVSNLDNSLARHPDWAKDKRFAADLRVFVDGQLRASRLDFTRADGELTLTVELSDDDHFLTFVTSDAGGRDGFDHVVLIDPVLNHRPRK